MSPLALRDHIRNILDFVAKDIETAPDEQTKKSHGEKRKNLGEDSAAETHASLRHAGGFNMNQMVSEYRLFGRVLYNYGVSARKKRPPMTSPI